MRLSRALRFTLSATAVLISMLSFVFVALLAALSVEAHASPFPDVPATHPYAEAISGMRDAGVIDGFAEGTFGPDRAVMRHQFGKMIVLSLGQEPLPGTQCPFADVDQGWPYPRSFVAAAAQLGITKGTTPTTFSPWNKISRAQVVTMVVRALTNLRPGILISPPQDYSGTLGNCNPTHAPFMRAAELNGLLTGLVGSGTG